MPVAARVQRAFRGANDHDGSGEHAFPNGVVDRAIDLRGGGHLDGNRKYGTMKHGTLRTAT